MSRSKHTDPRAIRAARRIAVPRNGRGEGDLSLRRRRGQLAKEMGIASDDVGRRAPSQPARPRIIERRPRPGFHHPAGRKDVLRILECVSPEAIYGVRSIELSHAPARSRSRFPGFGRLCVPGRILLYEQPIPPWRLSGMIAAHDAVSLAKAGAVLAVHKDVGVTLIHWPGDTLRQFMLFDVLLHEVGHHILQHHKGKRLARIARTRDHEEFAERFVEKCRLAWAEMMRAS